ncbi:MAG: hypothetical protein A2W09_08220 [Deltaproteobacteria bacterium RBG_16_50_11]|nr:MAG: hypothetical protein A2W09_08220 [Deltaproteobacteria bacterium RBG_16_50_11]
MGRDECSGFKSDGAGHFERSHRAFARSIQIPQEVQGYKINATSNSGISKERPKSEKARKREVRIRVE